MAPGGEERADAFYRDILGLPLEEKPEPLASRGGRWYRIGAIGLHLGVEADFRPSQKAHVCIVVSEYAALIRALERAGYEVQPDDQLPGVVRSYVHDPFGNRIEIHDATH